MKKIVGTILKVTNVFVVLLYLSACLIPVLPAGKFWMIAVLGLVFPLLIFIVAVFAMGWLIARSKWCLLSLVALLVSWQQISIVAGLNAEKEFTFSKSNETLRVFTWNISSWGETSKSRERYVDCQPMMLDLIKKQQADVLCFQEFWDKRGPQYSNIHEFNKMGYPYSYFVRTIMENVSYNIGVVILSKYPIIDTAQFTYGDNDFAEHLIYADIQFHQQKIRVFTTHLQSVRFDNEQYATLRKIKRTDEIGLNDSKTIFRKLRNGYRFRGTQADIVRQKINESPYPVIICGDFNDVPNSYTYFTIKGDLQDAFLEKGTGIGRTFRYLSPTLRIDYILAGKNFEVKQFNRIKAPYSDHYPLVTDLAPKN
ncbi:MAG: endonuclease/exonuclease/phosphatase family protein [Ferruginibacter sp.]|nr:endonuclease/exonuclease/phosphatase family protein [Ferruginibacter sp.]